MMKRKVLVISYYFPPMSYSGVQRTSKFVKYMPDFGWEPTVLTIQPKAYYAFDDSLLKEIENKGLRIIRTGSSDPTQILFNQNKIKSDFTRKILNRLSQTFFLPDNKRSWIKPALKKAKEILSTEKFDIIYATAPPYTDLIIGAKLKEEFDIPLVLDYRDAWLDDVLSFYPTPIHRLIVKNMERNVLHNSNRIIVYTRQIKEHLLINYPFLSPEEIIIIPHGYDKEDFQIEVKSDKPKHKMRITYNGIFYDERTPLFFIQAAKQLFFERPDLLTKIEFCFVGNFPEKYKRLIKKLKIEEAFRFIGYVDHKTSVKYLLDSDALWLMIRHSKNPHLVATSKLFEYFGTKKMILGCVPPNGAAAQLLKEYSASIVVHPEDINGIKEALLNIFNMYKSNLLPAGKDDFVEKFERKRLTEELIKIFQFQMKD